MKRLHLPKFYRYILYWLYTSRQRAKDNTPAATVVLTMCFVHCVQLNRGNRTADSVNSPHEHVCSGHNKVKINSAVLEDQSVQSNHRLFEEALRHNVTGVIIESDTNRTSGNEHWFRVKFHFFTAPLKEDLLILLVKE